MQSSDEVVRLLTEIRDTGREHLAEYRRVAARSVALQEQMSRIYKRVLLVCGIVVVVILLLLASPLAWL